jgi:type IV pilus assembly protein PilM
MALFDYIQRLWSDPPPEYAFEISEAGIALAPCANAGQMRFRPFEPEVLSVSPVHDNLNKPEAFAAHVAALAPSPNGRKRRSAALILPDYAARVQVLDFDSFPALAEEQLALVRFRARKSVPFDVESAVVSYWVQPSNGSGKVDVVAAIIALEIVARYEAPFRAAGFQPGFVTTSALAALNLAPRAGRFILLKLSGRALSALALEDDRLKLVRCVELERVESDDILAVLYPTLAYMEDEMSAGPEKLLLCGFGDLARDWAPRWQSELNLPVETLASRFGTPEPYNAGLLGYLTGWGAGA